MKNVRLQFEVTEEKSKSLDELMATCGITTKKELFNYALTLLEWAIEEKELGHDIASINKDENQLYTLKMPIFSRINKRADRAL